MPSQSFFDIVTVIDRLSESCVSNATAMLDAILIFAVILLFLNYFLVVLYIYF